MEIIMNQFDNYELTTIDYALMYYLEQNPNLDEEYIKWCNLVRQKVDSIIVSQASKIWDVDRTVEQPSHQHDI